MHKVKLLGVRISLLTVLLCGSVGRAEEQRLKVVIKHATTEPWETGDPAVAAYRIRFELSITNLGKEIVTLGSAPVAVLQVQDRKADGSWSTVVQNSWYDAGEVKYAPCFQLPGGKTVQIPHLQTGLTQMKETMATLGENPVLRFRIQVLCRQRDGQIHNSDVLTTDPIAVRLPQSFRRN